MDAPEAAPLQAEGPRAVSTIALALALAGATALAAILGNGNPAAALAPVAALSAAWAASRLPLRASASGLLFLLLALDDHAETHGQWRTPLAALGDLLHGRLDEAAGVPGLAVTGMEVAAVFLLAVHLLRGGRDGPPRAEGPSRAGPAGVLRDLALLYVAAVVASDLLGVARGLPVAPWKLRNLLHPLLLALLFLAAFRVPRDLRLLGRIVVSAACVKAALAVLVQRVAVATTGGRFATATNHGDSVLFAVAAVLLLGGLTERLDRRAGLRAALLLPILLAGAMENERRIVWVMLAMAAGFAYLVSPPRPWKRALTTSAVLALPVVALYAGVGWNREGGVFAPVRTLRSIVDTSSNRSSYWREVEAWNLAMSMRHRPLLGAGLGGEYTEYMPNDDISFAYKEYREWPHNTVLGLLFLMGLFGFTATWLLLPAALYLAVRSHRRAARAEDRVAALGCAGAVIACLVLAYGDTGAHYPQYKVFAALAVAISAGLAAATGAWPARRQPAFRSEKTTKV